MSARAEIFARIRSRVRGDAAAADARLAARRINLIPERGKASLDAFEAMAREASATVARVRNAAEVPGAIADYLRRENLPARAAIAPDPWLAGLDWKRSLLETRPGRADPADEVSVTPALAAVAETGTLVLTSGPGTPTTLNLLPETHIVVVRRDQVVGAYEDAVKRVRAAGAMPRTVNFITGPSRSADIEQQLQMGAHGPRRLHIVVVDEHG